jgi:hypothetical protein
MKGEMKRGLENFPTTPYPSFIRRGNLFGNIF